MCIYLYLCSQPVLGLAVQSNFGPVSDPSGGLATKCGLHAHADIYWTPIIEAYSMLHLCNHRRVSHPVLGWRVWTWTGHKSIYIISVDPRMLRYHKNVISQLVARTPKPISRFKTGLGEDWTFPGIVPILRPTPSEAGYWNELNWQRAATTAAAARAQKR